MFLATARSAHRLGVTEGTVKRHLHNIFTKLAASSRIEAVNKARAAGLLRGLARRRSNYLL
jgi:two-component system nitrate/nitrite response regulator NarL